MTLAVVLATVSLTAAAEEVTKDFHKEFTQDRILLSALPTSLEML